MIVDQTSYTTECRVINRKEKFIRNSLLDFSHVIMRFCPVMERLCLNANSFS